MFPYMSYAYACVADALSVATWSSWNPNRPCVAVAAGGGIDDADPIVRPVATGDEVGRVADEVRRIAGVALVPVVVEIAAVSGNPDRQIPAIEVRACIRPV